MKKNLLLIFFLTCFYSILFCQTKTKPKSTTSKPTKSKSISSKISKKPNSFVEVAKIEVEEEITPVIAEPGKEIVAIYPFTTSRGYDYEYAQSVGNAVEAGFVKSSRFTVVERTRFGSIKTEERFQEVNTSSIVKVASKFGAKYIVSGHITGANTGELHDSQGKFTGYQTSISVAFKIIDVETSQIKVTENLNLAGSGGSTASSVGSAYSSIDGVTRRVIASYFPQRFPFMAIVAKETKKKEEQLTAFKIWGGSDHGLKAGDMVEIYVVTEVMNPATKKKISEKQLVGAAEISQINSGTTATCTVFKPRKYGKALLDLVSGTPEIIAIEYTGGQRPKSFWDSL